MDNQDLLKKTLKTVAAMLAASTLFLGGLGGLTIVVIGHATSASSSPSASDTSTTNAGAARPSSGSSSDVKRAADARSGTQI